MNRAADNPEGQDRLAAFHQGLQELGWGIGRNVRIDTRWSEDNADRSAKYAAELVALAPDIILASGTLAVTALQHISRTSPIVFASSVMNARRLSGVGGHDQECARCPTQRPCWRHEITVEFQLYTCSQFYSDWRELLTPRFVVWSSIFYKSLYGRSFRSEAHFASENQRNSLTVL